jgi:hypothetical protein
VPQVSEIKFLPCAAGPRPAAPSGFLELKAAKRALKKINDTHLFPALRKNRKNRAPDHVVMIEKINVNLGHPAQHDRI